MGQRRTMHQEKMLHLSRVTPWQEPEMGLLVSETPSDGHLHKLKRFETPQHNPKDPAKY